MKVLLTGESGILGTDIAKVLQLHGHDFIGFHSGNIELADPDNVRAKVESYLPDTIIHCAAMTNVDRCEDEREEAFRINVTGTANMAEAAQQTGAKIVYISSCGVYGNGKSAPYREEDATVPVNYHHTTKLEGEKRIKALTERYLIIRPGWLFGGSLKHQKNFVEARRREISKTRDMKGVNDKFGSPTYTADLARQIIYLLEEQQSGTFNVVNEGCVSRYEYVSEIIRLFGFDVQITPVSAREFPRRANMPDNECLENYNLNNKRVNKMRGWKDALADYINLNYYS